MAYATGKKTKKLEADLVVIGGGGAGLAAALTAAEKGVARIIVLEKRAGPGGNTAMATGLFACESPAQKRQSITADKDQLFQRATDWAHWSQINPRILRAFLNKSGDTIRWLEEKGLEFNVIAFFPNQNPRVEHVPKGKGAELTQVLATQCREAGVQLLTRTAGKKIRRDKDGKVAGVTAIGGEELEISAGRVIIASGWESETYCSDLSGSAFGYAINSGRIAGENAARFISNMSKGEATFLQRPVTDKIKAIESAQ